MVIYIVILILDNFTINLFLLLATLKAIKYKYYKTIYLAGFLGSIYTLVLFMDNKILVSLPFKVIMVFVMISISMKSLNILRIIKASFGFVICSFTLCGISFSFSMINQNEYIFDSFKINNYSIKYIIISLMVFYIVVLRIIDYLRERTLIKSFIYDIEISNDDNKILIKGLLDTGNALREPVTNLPCIIIESEFLKGSNIKSKEEFFIPYSTIGEEGKLLGFKSNEVRIKGEDNIWRSIEVIICKCENKLSKENEFNALLSRGVI